MALLSVIVVLYNPDADVEKTFKHLNKMREVIDLEVVVVDNASTNSVTESLQKKFPEFIYVRSRENLGFGGGNNLGFSYTSGEYILCLNPDLLISAEATQALIDTIETQPNIGIVGPKTLDGDGDVVITARADYTVGRLWAKYWALDRIAPRAVYGMTRAEAQSVGQILDVDWLQGSCLLMRRPLFELLDGFDDSFFLYMEDVDLCRRIRAEGYRVVYDPSAVVIHFGGTTTARFHAIRIRGYHLSPLRYHEKHGRSGSVFALRLILSVELLVKALLRTFLAFGHGSKAELKRRRAIELQVLGEVWKYSRESPR